MIVGFSCYGKGSSLQINKLLEANTLRQDLYAAPRLDTDPLELNFNTEECWMPVGKSVNLRDE
jgi:hypothetical protein